MRPALPRPPAAIWPFTTHGAGGSAGAASAPALSTRQPAGTAMPCRASSSLASCSRRYMMRRVRDSSLLLAPFKERRHEALGLVGLPCLDAGADAGLHGLADGHALPVAHQLLLQA